MVPAIAIPILGENLVADKGLHSFFDTGADGVELVRHIGGNAANSLPADRTPPNPKTDFIPLGMKKSSWAGMYVLPTASGT